MKIEHLAIWARDLDGLCAFYQKYFQAQVGDLYVNPAKRFSSRFLRFESGARLEIMQMNSVASSLHEPLQHYFGIAHFAISAGSRQQVDQLTAELKKDGHPILDGPRTTGDGCYESAVLDPEGNRLEITE